MCRYDMKLMAMKRLTMAEKGMDESDKRKQTLDEIMERNALDEERGSSMAAFSITPILMCRKRCMIY